MERKYLVLGFIIVSVVLLSGCVQKEEPGPIVGDCLIHCSDGTSVLCNQECPAGVAQLNVYAEADITAQVLQPFVINGETTKYLPAKVTKVVGFSGQSLIQEEDGVSLYISGIEDLGCKEIGSDPTLTEIGDCENEGKPDKLYANWKVIALKTGDVVNIHVRCLELTESKCSFWEAADSSIILVQWVPV